MSAQDDSLPTTLDEARTRAADAPAQERDSGRGRSRNAGRLPDRLRTANSCGGRPPADRRQVPCRLHPAGTESNGFDATRAAIPLSIASSAALPGLPAFRVSSRSLNSARHPAGDPHPDGRTRGNRRRLIDLAAFGRGHRRRQQGRRESDAFACDTGVRPMSSASVPVRQISPNAPAGRRGWADRPATTPRRASRSPSRRDASSIAARASSGSPALTRPPTPERRRTHLAAGTPPAHGPAHRPEPHG